MPQTILVVRCLRTQFTSDGSNSEAAKIKNSILMGVSTPVGVPLILPQGKRPSRIAHWKSNVEKV